MSFEVFDDTAVKEEVRVMLLALKKADYALSDLSKEQIQEWANHFNTPVLLRYLKNGKVKVKLCLRLPLLRTR